MLRMLLTGPLGFLIYFLTGVLVSLKAFGVLEIPWWAAWMPLWFAVAVSVLWAIGYTIAIAIHSTRR